MRLTDTDRAMLDGAHGPAVGRAMDLLVRYGQALGAEQLVDTNNVCGANIFGARHLNYPARTITSHDEAFSELSLDSDEVVEVPQVRAYSCQLIGPMDSRHWELQGLSRQARDAIADSESYSGRHGIHLLSTCTPYQVGNVPVRGEHCAWMESSAVVYINSVLGARSNVEGRESTGAAMLTRRIPYWGLHDPGNRFATDLVDVRVEAESVLDWGLLGYFVGSVVQDRIPALRGITTTPDLVRLKHFGAAASSSGGVELYHIPGVTAEARTEEEAFGGAEPRRVFGYGPRERRETYEALNSTAAGAGDDIDLVMIGCPHATMEQVRQVCTLLEGRRVADGTHLWVFTPSQIRALADRNGFTERLAAAGAALMSDTCPAIGQFLPDGTRVIATDSAKQVHYLPAIMGVQGRFGSVETCVEAAVTGRWPGEAL
ncbi:aconitase X [Allosalinactinospora lopnorensis]|uniref:aconitase X n=1 Tax=Allosalinactinospora lopnorensis TaxID=1352348 RepID=UPI000623BA41|nr:aconitase X catalytic domain-containing protein [Allosalinactinospora lopnorensis]